MKKISALGHVVQIIDILILSITLSTSILGPAATFITARHFTLFSLLEGYQLLPYIIVNALIFGLPLALPIVFIFLRKKIFYYTHWGMSGGMCGVLVAMLLFFIGRIPIQQIDQIKLFLKYMMMTNTVSVPASLLCCHLLKRHDAKRIAI